MSISTMFSKARDAHHGCNAALCPNGKCNSTGECQDRSTVVAAARKKVTEQFPKTLAYLATCEAPPLVPALPRTLIAFTGLAGSGKSTAAQHLVKNHGFQRLRFAGPLKDMMRALGLTEAEIEGDRKEMPCDLLGGKTPRYAMQTIGTEWGRDIIAPDLWIRAFNAALAKVPADVPVVVDDCRFPNEADAIIAAGGVLVRVVRPGAGAGASGHSSEGQPLPVVGEIQNDVSLPTFIWSVDRFVRDFSWCDNTPA